MKRILFACLLMALSCASASAATCVIVEHQIDLVAGAQVAKLPPVTTPQNITVTGSSTQSAAFSGDTKMIMAWCDTQSAIEVGTNPTASATVSTPISAGLPQYWRVDPASGLKAAFILRP